MSSNITEAANIIKGLLLFCPVPSDAQCRISSEDINVATSKCCILGKSKNFECKWSGILPAKC